MHKGFIFLCILCFLGCIPKNKFIDFKPILGTWIQKDSSMVSLEHWKLIKNEIHGIGYVFVNKDTVFKEELKLKKILDQYYYEVKINGNRDSENFKLTNYSTNYWEFERQENDFPQKISYHLKDSKRLNVVLEGKEGKKFKSVYYTFVKQQK